MMLALPPSRARLVYAGAFATLVVLAETLIVHSRAFAVHPDVLAAAAAFDLTVTVPLAWWWLVVRPGVMRARSLLPVLGLAVIVARLVLPADHRSFVGAVRWLTAPLELALVIAAVRGVRAAVRRSAHAGDAAAPDAAEAIDGSLRALLGDHAAAGVAASEIATLHYALLARRPAVRAAAPIAVEGGFTPSLVAALGMATVVEGVGLHLWLAPAHPAIAWTLTALSLYTLVWLVGHQRAASRRVSAIVGDALVLRVGLTLSARLPLGEVAEVRRLDWRTQPAKARDYLNAARPAEPNVLLVLRRPTTVAAAFGLRRAVTRIGLAVKDPAAFVARVVA